MTCGCLSILNPSLSSFQSTVSMISKFAAKKAPSLYFLLQRLCQSWKGVPKVSKYLYLENTQSNLGENGLSQIDGKNVKKSINLRDNIRQNNFFSDWISDFYAEFNRHYAPEVKAPFFEFSENENPTGNIPLFLAIF